MYRTDKQFMKNPATASSRIYIGSLAKTVVADDLEMKFKAHGNILGLVLQSGFAFIQFQHDYEAQAAIQKEHGSMLHNRKIVVKPANQDKKGPAQQQNQQQLPQQNMQQNQQNKPQPLMQQPQYPPPLLQTPPGGPIQNQRGPGNNANMNKNQRGPPTNIPINTSKPSPQKPPQAGPPPRNMNQNMQVPQKEFDFSRDVEPDTPIINANRPPVNQPMENSNESGFDFENSNEMNKRKRRMRGPAKNRKNFDSNLNAPTSGPPISREMFNEPGPGSFYGREEFRGPPASSFVPSAMTEAPIERNDCEIIVVAKELTKYAEFIEHSLKQLGLLVDLLFPNEDVPIGKVLANISSRGCLYAILVMPQNEEHRSLTLNILHGIPQEHRNMPIEDALILISRNFEAYMRGEKSIPEKPGQMSLEDRHPQGIQMILNLLAENRQITATQYDKLIKYLHERKELQLEYEGVEGSNEAESQESSKPNNPKEAELQNRIMSILNKSGDTATNPTSITAPKIAEEKPNAPTPLLKDPSVQKALDSLFLGDMFKKVA